MGPNDQDPKMRSSGPVEKPDDRARMNGFTLVELMVAVAIMAIIAAVALPFYNQYSQRTYRTEAQADLLACAQAIERMAAVSFSYENAADTDADGVGDANAGPVATTLCDPLSVEQGRYNITVNSTVATFDLTATPIGMMAGDGILTFDSTGARGWDQNGDGDTLDADEQNWEEE
jgi:type IV pilus assembly protein PilE